MPPDILARVKVQPAPALAFAGTGVGGSLLFLRCLAGIEQLGSKHFLSCWTAPFLVPWLERVGLSWGLFYLPLWMFPGCWLALLQVQDILHEASKQKTPGNSPSYCSLGLKVSSFTPFFSPAFGMFLCLVHGQCPGFIVLLSGRSKETYN